MPQNQLSDIHSYHPNYMFNTSEVTNEYNLLNDFLSTSLIDDGAFYQGTVQNPPTGVDALQSTFFNDPSFSNIMGPLSLADPATLSWPNTTTTSLSHHLAPPTPQQSTIRPTITDTTSLMPSHSSIPVSIPTPSPTTATNRLDKAQEKYYLTAADPAGLDTPEVRMQKLLRAKYEAGLLKPYNYVKGYATLSSYMDSHTSPSTRNRVLRQLEKFRPKFRERMQRLTDIELVMVEMWFERKLMEYDRVFASMAVPACCWRRTGEVCRGNREMAELVGVPLERLRDVSLHYVLTPLSIYFCPISGGNEALLTESMHYDRAN